MKATEFCYWLQGYFEINDQSSTSTPPTLNSSQVEVIKRHLQLVFVHDIDPSYPAEQQSKLNSIHNDTQKTTGPLMRC
ncbi:hypothetical protein EVB32_188 [Rhizobium phage RHph_TM39]|uniref:Uncharacterized protein n=1 Tax=Rhizobium phage RHph_Y65 TaxID=2509785 RepID=A0A7S5UXQ8_9CAUD|nr:hypothetical protein PQC17_gp198 [Rhizobium phage RHph_Y65]QIG72031.1 hypothetical protein EVB95_197 [Rhizobium phage RHph_TM2_3B]QIG72394.1 hypothetical protein EVB96_198 [Rhizobium phage RHph_TM3_3_6]QIG72756.1 hypothetical protein EVB97_198 [Rhizobium phage RHph_Y65]QIG77176.1 hypothetical protein EVB32_188 [Rhizobium phage RHph_TM39]